MTNKLILAVLVAFVSTVSCIKQPPTSRSLTLDVCQRYEEGDQCWCWMHGDPNVSVVIEGTTCPGVEDGE